MSVRWIEILPKTQFFGDLTQSTEQAIDLAGLRVDTIQVWGDNFQVVPPGDDCTITLEQATTNDDNAYQASPTVPIVVGALATGSVGMVVQAPSISSRFIRLNLVFSLLNGSIPNIRVRIRVRPS